MKNTLVTTALAAVTAFTLIPTSHLQADPPPFELRIGPQGRPRDPGSDELFKAMDNLQKAKKHIIQSGPPTPRRADALRAIDAAIDQVRAIMDRGR
ncbi:MAG: hypothetical protein ACFUZC_23055 [Chthoniobacteraceae bacterium]